MSKEVFGMNENQESKDIYAAPESNLSESSKDEEIFKQLKRQQSITIGIIVAVVVGVTILEILAQTLGRIPMYAFLIPGFVVGGLIKILARPFTMLARLIPGFVLGAIVFMYFSINVITIYSIFLPILNILICLAVSRRLMSYDQESVLYRRRLGR